MPPICGRSHSPPGVEQVYVPLCTNALTDHQHYPLRCREALKKRNRALSPRGGAIVGGEKAIHVDPAVDDLPVISRLIEPAISVDDEALRTRDWNVDLRQDSAQAITPVGALRWPGMHVIAPGHRGDGNAERLSQTKRMIPVRQHEVANHDIGCAQLRAPPA